MAFLLNCDNKGCNKVSEAKLDVNSNQVICSECGGEIKNVSSFAKNQMKALGQTMKSAAKQKPYAVKCGNCDETDTPKLENNKIVCVKCGAPSKMSAPFEKMLREHIKNNKL